MMVRTEEWFYVELAIGLANLIVAQSWFLVRRRHFPIHGRHIPLITFMVVCFAVFFSFFVRSFWFFVCFRLYGKTLRA